MVDATSCGTGKAGGTLETTNAYDWFCDTVVPLGALSNGAGGYCFDTHANCLLAPNGCNANVTVNGSVFAGVDCVVDFTRCSTGVAAASAHQYSCVSDVPAGSYQNGFGVPCYDTFSNCLSGPNLCDMSTPCQIDANTCSSGESSAPAADGSLTAQNFCASSLPPASSPTMGGLLCYTSAHDCYNGPNACGSDEPCIDAPWFCATGLAGASGASWVCQSSIPVLGDQALPTAAGLLCFSSLEGCTAAPSPCGDANPCVFDAAVCSTGLAATAAGAYYCPLSIPWAASLSPTSGLLCYNGSAACLLAANGCGSSAVCTFPPDGVCPSGMLYCPVDVPPNGTLSTSGSLCFNNLDSCANSTACGLPPGHACVATLGCPAAFPYECARESAAKEDTVAVTFAFSVMLDNGTDVTDLHNQLVSALSATLGISAVQVSVSVAAAPSGRRLLSSVAFSANISISTPSSAAAALSALVVTGVQASTLSSSLGFGAQQISVLAQPATLAAPLPTQAARLADIVQLLALSAPRIVLSSHLLLTGTSLEVLRGAKVTVVGNTSACMASGSDPSGTGLCTLDAARLSQHFRVAADATLRLENVALLRGAARGTSSLNRDGGSIVAAANSVLLLVNTSIVNSTAALGYGGAVYTAGVVSMDAASSVSGCSEFAGGDVFSCSPANPSFNAATGGCLSCPSGQILVGTDCIPCPRNTYSLNLSVCTSCPSPSTTSAAGAPSLAFCNCPSNTYRLPVSGVTDSLTCLACPDGAVCPGGGDNRAYALDGYWRMETADAAAFFDCDDDQWCKAEQYTPTAEYVSGSTLSGFSAVQTSPDSSGALCQAFGVPSLCINNTRPPNCRVGHGGPACGVCLPGFSMQQGFCLPCPASEAFSAWPTSEQVTVILFPLGIAATVLLLFLWNKILPASVARVVDMLTFVARRVTGRIPAQTHTVRLDKTMTHPHAEDDGQDRAAAARLDGGEKHLSPAGDSGGSESDSDSDELPDMHVPADDPHPVKGVSKRKRFLHACKANAGTLSLSLRIIIDNCQVVASFQRTMRVTWPREYTKLSSFLTATNLNIMQLPRIGCLEQHTTFYPYFLGLCLSVLFFLFLIGAAWAIGLQWSLRQGYTVARLQAYSGRALSCVLHVLYFSYMPLSETVLAIFSCRPIGDAQYLSEDASLQCYTPRYDAWRKVGFVFTILYPIGIPVAFLLVLLAFRIPYLARLKEDVEYLRRLIDQCARDNVFVSVNHAKLSLSSLSTEQIDVLWVHFMEGRRASLLSPSGFVESSQRDLKFLLQHDKNLASMAGPLYTAVEVVRDFLDTRYKRYIQEGLLGIEIPRTHDALRVQLLVAHARSQQQKFAIGRLTWHHKSPIREVRLQEHHAESAAFLFEEFYVSAWHWELVELVKKLLVSSALRFARPGSAIQVFVGLLICYFFQQVYAATLPFVNPAAQRVGYMSTVNLYAFFVIAIVLKTGTSIVADPVLDAAVKGGICSLLLFSIFALPFMVAGTQFVMGVRDHFHASRGHSGKHEEHGGGEPVHNTNVATKWKHVFGDFAQLSRARDAALREARRNAGLADLILELADGDGDGMIDLAEFRRLLGMLGIQDAAEQARLFALADADGSGEVSLQEFEEWWQQLHI